MNYLKYNLLKCILTCLIAFAATCAIAQEDGYIKNVEFHSVSLEGNLIGDSPDRSILIYLPPGYDEQVEKRYPVVYLLHGFNGSTGNQGWVGEYASVIPSAIKELIRSGTVKPMILVMPDGSNRFGGSMYSNSIATGNWEDFIVHELTEYIDKNYRSIPDRNSRGIAGHSMGGYGAIKLGMKNPDVFSAVYGTSSCCLAQSPNDFSTEVMSEMLSIKSWGELEKANFFPKAILAQSAAYAPNPDNPPFYGDTPFVLTDGTMEQDNRATAKWLANISILDGRSV